MVVDVVVTRVDGTMMDMATVVSGYEEVDEEGRRVTSVVEACRLGNGGEGSGYQRDLGLGEDMAVEAEAEDVVVEDGEVRCFSDGSTRSPLSMSNCAH